MSTTLHEAPEGTSTPTIAVSVMLNIAADHFDGYQPGHTLRHVADMRVPVLDDTDAMLEQVYLLCNVGSADSDDPQIASYRRRRNRSLSTGDVLVIDGVANAVDSLGFLPVPVDPEQVSRTGKGDCATGIDEAV